MAQSKKNLFSKRDVELTDLMKCLSHPARLSLLMILSKHKDRTCKELVLELPLSQSTVSKHLNDLLNAGLICRKLNGKKSLYCIEWNTLERFYVLTAKLQASMMPNRPKRNCC